MQKRLSGNRDIDLSVRLGGLTLSNPIMVAAGTYGYIEEYSQVVRLERLGALIAKTITLHKRPGAEGPRIVETASGILNAVGLDNCGIDTFCKRHMPFLRSIGVPIIVSIGADNQEQFVRLADILDNTADVSAIELNLSCPNLSKKKEASPLLCQDKRIVKEIVQAVRRKTRLTLITKLSSEVSDLIDTAKVALDSGSDVLCLINTIRGLAIDLSTKRPILGSGFGGLSGPAIKPIALSCVAQVSRRLGCPIIGIGGVMHTRDVLEFMTCGAYSVGVGTANFVNPSVIDEIIDGLIDYAREKGIVHLKDIIGRLKIR